MELEIYEHFSSSIREILKSMGGVDVVPEGNFHDESNEITILGVASMINFTGKRKGRIMLDMEESLAIQLATTLTGESYSTAKNMMVLASVSEINNIFSGSAVTSINDKFGFKLWMAPPVVMTGKNVFISIPKLTSASMVYNSPFGKLRINVAMEREG